MRRAIVFAAWLLCAALSGCVIFEVSVTNPVAGLTTVAVAPFFNLSEEPTVDGRRFAQAYFAALQQTPGFEVVPVGVVEQAIHDHRLEMTSPDDALKLAQILHVDAVVIGSVNDYSPYYPPRIGMKVAWYSPYQWQFVPGIADVEEARDHTLHPEPRFQIIKSKPRRWGRPEACPPVEITPAPTYRGQSEAAASQEVEAGIWSRMKHGKDAAAFPADSAAGMGMTSAVWSSNPQPFNPRDPLMAYTRLFDGADPKLTARLRDFRELSGDLRAGGWEAYLHRSEDFIRFTSHVMVVEMLQLHGGEAQRRVVIKRRTQR